jgi:hypothetical protein
MDRAIAGGHLAANSTSPHASDEMHGCPTNPPATSCPDTPPATAMGIRRLRSTVGGRGSAPPPTLAPTRAPLRRWLQTRIHALTQEAVGWRPPYPCRWCPSSGLAPCRGKATAGELLDLWKVGVAQGEHGGESRRSSGRRGSDGMVEERRWRGGGEKKGCGAHP